MTTSYPFPVNPIGTTLGVASFATYANRARSRLSISWLIGFSRISATSLVCIPALLPVRPLDIPDRGQVRSQDADPVSRSLGAPRSAVPGVQNVVA
jgi:hypothetical protein